LSVETNSGRTLFLNPGEPAVVKHIADVVKEIVYKYPVDGIHFDDYFYPFEPIGDADRATWHRYNPRKMSINDWRRANVTAVIRQVHQITKAASGAAKRKIRFGVSPFGIWANRSSSMAGSLTGGKESRNDQYADTRSWVKNGYLDYIVPQLYWGFSHRRAAYAALVYWWSDVVRGTSVDLYIGHAIYRIGSSSEWPENEVANQLLYNQKFPEIKGSVLYSYHHLFERKDRTKANGISLILNRLWVKPALPR
jgi:uncharacterized lipoprotein YddW (UPF0748 family)